MTIRTIVMSILLALFTIVIAGCAQPKSCVQKVKGAEEVETD